MRRQHRTHPDPRGASGAARPSVPEINGIARRQHGLVTRGQLLARGMGPRAIDRRIEAGRLVRVRRCVYRVGPIREPLEHEMAAILAVGADAVLSHRSAAALHQLLPYPANSGPVEITVTGSDPGPKPELRIHRTKHLPGDERMRLNRIPVTTPARTIIDIAPTLRRAELEQLLAEAHRKRLAGQIHILIARYPRRPGVPAIRAMLQGRPKYTRSRSERRLLEALRNAGFDPETNIVLAGHEVDLYLPAQNLVVEVDGHPFHSSRPDRRRDHARDAELQALGYAVIRFDADEPAERVLAVVARATR